MQIRKEELRARYEELRSQEFNEHNWEDKAKTHINQTFDNFPRIGDVINIGLYASVVYKNDCGWLYAITQRDVVYRIALSDLARNTEKDWEVFSIKQNAG